MARKTERLEAEIAVKDNATDQIEKIIKSNKKLSTEMLRLRENMNRMKRSAAKRTEIKIETAKAKANLDNLKGSLDRVRSSATNTMNGLKTLGAIAGTTLAAGFGYAIKSGLELEKQMASMQHFIGVNNKGMNKKQVGQQADAYVKEMRKYATATPFGTNEVMEAGTRAIGVAGGDTKQAKDLMKVAGDMAAVTPGKTMMDAMEALADAKTGEMERLKEFGFKVSAEEFKGFAGKGAKDNLNAKETNKAYSTLVNQKLNPYFKGGAKAIGETKAGKISTITGNVQSGLTDAGTNMLNSMDPKMLDELVVASQKLGTTLGNMGVKAAKMFITLKNNISAVKKGLIILTSAVVSFKIAMASLVIMRTIITLFKAWRAGTIKQTIAQLSLNASMLANPLAWVALLIAGVVAAGVALYLNWDKVSKKAMKLWKDLRKWFGKIKDTTLETLQPVLDFFEKMGRKWDKFVQSVKDFKMPKIGIPKMFGGNGFIQSGKKKAIGGVIPRDNYPALLHRGERVQTQQEVHQEDRKQGGNKYKFGDIIIQGSGNAKQDARKLMNEIVRELEMAGGAGA